MVKNIHQFYDAISKNIIEFSYKKNDGTTRKAKGTVNMDLLNLTDKRREYLSTVFDLSEEFSLFDKGSVNGYFHYFDVESGGIRQFNPDKLQYKD